MIAEAADGIRMDMTDEELCIDLCIVGLTCWILVPLAGGLVCVARSMLPERLKIAGAIALGVVVAILYAAGVWTVVRLEILVGTAIAVVPGIGVDLFARVVANSCAAKVAASESIRTLTSAESLICDCES